MAGQNIEDLLVGLRLDTDKQSFDNGISSFNAVRGAAMRLAATITGGMGFDQLTRGFASSRQELGNFAEQMEVSAQGVRGLEFAFEQVGGQAGEARQTIEQMNRFRDALLRGDTQAFDAMSMLGLRPETILQAEDSVQAVERVTEAMRGMSDERRRIILQDMGIDSPAAFRLFGRGAAQLQAYMDQAAQLAPVTEDQVEAAREFQQSLNELQTAVQGIADTISMDLLPQLTDFSDWAKEFLIQNKDDIRLFLSEGPAAFGAKYGEIARERVSEWFNEMGVGWANKELDLSFMNQGNILGGDGGGTADPEPRFPNSDLTGNRSLREAVAQMEREIGAPKGLLWAQIGQESSYNPNAVSEAGARGLAQIMPNTERSLEERFGEKMNPFDPMDAIRMQGELMRENYQMSGNWDEALRMYHGGWDRSQWGPRNRDYVPSIRGRMESQSGGPQASVNQNVNIQIDGAGDANRVAMQIDRRLRQHAERAADGARSSVV